MNIKSKPFLLQPVYKEYLWGGRRLADDYNKDINLDKIAESWECSTHPDGVSIVASGDHRGKLLSNLLKLHPEYMGTHPLSHDLPDGQIPILVKLIDAEKDLSIQVHPDDMYAKRYENGELGKTEMWYILDTMNDSKLVYGLANRVDKDTLKKDLQQGCIKKHLQYISVKKNDVFYIEPGIIHAIGGGIVLAEIQENSNLTYRIYDYDRIDKDGNKRELHIEKALEVAKLEASDSPRQPIRILQYRPACANELLCRCKYYQVERMILNTESVKKMVPFQSDSNSFNILLCITGCGILSFCNEVIPFFKGDCIFVPADSIACRLHGSAQLLKICC